MASRVVSLGGCCATAIQMRRRNLRPQSLGLDWMGNRYSPEWIEPLCEGLINHFQDFCLKENLEPIRMPADGAKGFFETKYKMHILHSFKSWSDSPDWYVESIGTIRKRMVRFFDICNSTSSVYFILCTYYCFEDYLARRLYATLKEVFPALDFKLRIMQFGCREYSVWADAGLEVYRYQREIGYYDMHKTSSEWAFLDDFMEVGQRPNLMYKLWKLLSKRLLRKNCDLDMYLAGVQ